MPASRRRRIPTVKRMTMPKPSGVKKRGVYTAFSPQTYSMGAESLEIRIRQRKQVNEYLRRDRLQRKKLIAIQHSFIDASGIMYDSKKTDEQILTVFRAALAAVEDYAQLVAMKKVDGIKVALLDGVHPNVEVPLKEIENAYWSVFVRDMAEEYVGNPKRYQQDMARGTCEAMFDEMYTVPASLLESFKTLRKGRVYNLFTPAEKKLLSDAINWFMERTPPNVYKLRDGAPYPSWYLKDLHAYMGKVVAEL